ncbi:MAG TPA: MmgE/PrpD family protein [Vineibacter sp.]|nr:MmgE/PrpD family protein [Vineibacter sp.]
MSLPLHLKRLGDFLTQTRFADLPPPIVDQAVTVVADCIAVIAAGAQEPEMRNLRALEGRRSGPRTCTVIGTRGLVDLRGACLLNGTAGTFLELDEGNRFCRGHPAIHVVPAAFAVAETDHRTGADFLLAVVLGYEVAARIGAACRMRADMHPHGTWGTVGAAVSVGTLRGGNASRLARLINLSAGLNLATSVRAMQEGGTVRNSYAGVAGVMALLADDLERSGFSGERDALATTYGRLVAEAFDTEALLDQLGSRYEIGRNYFKQHACCRYNHAALDALARLRAENPDARIDAGNITQIIVETYAVAATMDDPEPQNPLAAKYSLPFAMATAVVTGATGVKSFDATAVAHQPTRALAHRVRVVEDPRLTAMLPNARPARLRVVLKEGGTLQSEVSSNLGDSDSPYTAAELTAKFDDLGRPIWGDGASALHSHIADLPHLADCAQLGAILREHVLA